MENRALHSITLPAYAKVNLTLDVLGKRPDGYHDLRMVMQSVSLADLVTVTEQPGEEITVRCDRGDLPSGPSNIAWKAADAFFAAAGVPRRGLDIAIEKRIPAQAGMGGGSADGGAVLRVLRDWYAAAMPDAALARIGAAAGSDVPFCVLGGAALAEGRGEVLTPLPALPDCAILLCKPDFGLSTPALFRRADGVSPSERPDNDAMADALRRGDLAAAAENLRNVFEEALTEEERREIGEIKTAMLHGGALNAAMTGSGPTVFGLYADISAARAAAAVLRRRYDQVFLTGPQPSPPSHKEESQRQKIE